MQTQIVVFLSLLQGKVALLNEKKTEFSEWLHVLEEGILWLNEEEKSKNYFSAYWSAPNKSVRRLALSRMASQVMEAAGDTVLAYFLYNRSLPLINGYKYASQYYKRIDYLDRNHNFDVFDGAISLITNPQKDPFRKLLRDGARVPVEAIREVAGTVISNSLRS